MDCADLRTDLAAYLDDELDVAYTLDIQKHIVDCAACQRIHQENLALRKALTAADLRAHPSDDVLRRFDQAVRRAAKQDTEALYSSRAKLSRLALAAVALFAGWFFFAWVRSCHQQNIASAVLAAHIRSLQIDHLVDVRSSDRHTVKPWFQRKLDFSPPIPDLSEQGWS
jgi:anti-sigma factor RsiW